MLACHFNFIFVSSNKLLEAMIFVVDSGFIQIRCRRLIRERQN